jgi:hypothetical protein
MHISYTHKLDTIFYVFHDLVCVYSPWRGAGASGTGLHQVPSMGQEEWASNSAW